MPSFRWNVTVETNPGKDDVSRTSARAASTCPRCSLTGYPSSRTDLKGQINTVQIIIFFILSVIFKDKHPDQKTAGIRLWRQECIHCRWQSAVRADGSQMGLKQGLNATVNSLWVLQFKKKSTAYLCELCFHFNPAGLISTIRKPESKVKEQPSGRGNRPWAFAWLFIISNCQTKQHTAYRQHIHTITHSLWEALATDSTKLLVRHSKCNHAPAGETLTAGLMIHNRPAEPVYRVRAEAAAEKRFSHFNLWSPENMC